MKSKIKKANKVNHVKNKQLNYNKIINKNHNLKVKKMKLMKKKNNISIKFKT